MTVAFLCRKMGKKTICTKNRVQVTFVVVSYHILYLFLRDFLRRTILHDEARAIFRHGVEFALHLKNQMDPFRCAYRRTRLTNNKVKFNKKPIPKTISKKYNNLFSFNNVLKKPFLLEREFKVMSPFEVPSLIATGYEL